MGNGSEKKSRMGDGESGLLLYIGRSGKTSLINDI